MYAIVEGGGGLQVTATVQLPTLTKEHGISMYFSTYLSLFFIQVI